MAQTAQAGIAYLSLDGKSIRLVGEASYKLASPKREVLVGMDGVHGYKETPDAGYIKFTGRDAKDVDIASINDATDSTVTVEMNNGKTIVGRNMWRNGDPVEAKVDDATFEVEFAGLDVTEQ